MATILATGLCEGEGVDSAATAEEAVRQAKDKLERSACNATADMSIVYCSSRYDYQEVIDVVREETNKAPLLGCSTAGEFTEWAVGNGGIAVGLVSSDDIKFFTSMVEGVKEDPELAVRTVANEFPSKFDDGYSHLCAIMLIDGLAGVGEEVTLLASSAFNQIFGKNVMLVGGAAGDDLRFETTTLFSDNRVASDALSVCLLASKKPFFTGVQHGHVPVSPPLHITRADGCVLYEIEGRPAWEVWKEQTAEAARSIGIDTDKLEEPDAIGTYLMRFELGLSTKAGQYKIRIPLSKNEDGSLNFGCTIPEGAVFRLMESKQAYQIQSAREAAEIAMMNANGNVEIASAFIFDCACRGLILGDELCKGIGQFKSILGNIPMLGCETYGEICMEPGQFSGFHNTASVVLLIPK